MRYLAIAVSVVFLMAAAGVGAAPISQAPGLASATPSMLELIQAKKKSETVTQKIKRVWRSWTDHQFCARCPLIIPLAASTCSVKTGITGPSRDEARATASPATRSATSTTGPAEVPPPCGDPPTSVNGS